MEQKKKENIDFFYENLKDYLKDEKLKYKYVVIYNKELKNSFDTFDRALEYALSNFPQSEFAIQQVIGQDEQIGFLKSAI